MNADTVTAVKRKLPGRPRPAAAALAEYHRQNAWRWKSEHALARLFYVEPKDQHRWRIQLDCGHIFEVLTPAKDQLPTGPWQSYAPRLYGNFLDGTYPCDRDECQRESPYRDVVGWDNREEYTLEPDPEEPKYGLPASEWAKFRRTEPVTKAAWSAALSCGHKVRSYGIELDWKPEDGITRTTPEPGSDLARHWEEVLASDMSEDFKRDIRDGNPHPNAEERCVLCSIARTITAYEYAGPLVPPPPAPRKPADPRKALQRRLREAERQAQEIRVELAKLNRS